MRVLLAWTFAALFLVTALVNKAAEVAMEKEYETWAPRVARALARMAGFVCRKRRDRWWADLCFVQQVERKTGLVEALSCFINCWHLAVRDAIQRAVVDLFLICVVAIWVVTRRDRRLRREAEHIIEALESTAGGLRALEVEYKRLSTEIVALTNDVQRVELVSDSAISTRHQEQIDRLAALARQTKQSLESLENRRAALVDRSQTLRTQAATLRKRAMRKLTLPR